MCAARIMLLVREDTALRSHSFVSRSGEVRGWVEVGDRRELIVVGSPAQLRRLAVAAREAARAAEQRSVRVDLAVDDRPAAA